MNKIKSTERFSNMNRCRDCFSENLFITHESNFNFIETIQKIKKNGYDEGCFNPTINNYYELERSLGLENPNKVVSVSMCIPRLTNQLLKENIKLAAMIPFHIIVYEKDEKVYVLCWNFEKIRKIFGKTIGGILQKKSEIVKQIHKELIKNKEV